MISASVSIYARLLKECSKMKAIVEGKQVHAHLTMSGLDSNILMRNMLIDMYAKCGRVPDARQVFDKTPEHNVFSWTIIISTYAKQEHGGEEAIKLFERMQWEGVRPDNFTYVSILKACSSLGALERGKRVHAVIEKNGADSIFVGTCLVDMYAKCGSINGARKVFDRMCERNEVSWNAIITGYARNGHGEAALKLFDEMQEEGVEADAVTFVSILKACTSLSGQKHGKKVHAIIAKYGFGKDIFIGSALVDMYVKCRSIENARRVFDKMGERNVVSWNAMITGYAQCENGNEVLKLFDQMQLEGFKPDKVTFVNIIGSFARPTVLEQGRKVHALVREHGFESDLLVGSTLVDMYANCGSVGDARDVFDRMKDRNVVTWNAMIAGYAQHGHAEEALMLLEQMRREGLKPDEFTCVVILKACAQIAALEQGKQVHAHIKKMGFEINVYVGNALVDMYSKCGSIKDARQVFDEMRGSRDVVTWNAMITGWALHGHAKESLALYEQMQEEGIKPDMVTYTSLLSACSHAGLVEECFRLFDSMSRRHGIVATAEHYSCMVGLIRRTGGHEVEAEDFINKMPVRPDAVVWTSLLRAGGGKVP